MLLSGLLIRPVAGKDGSISLFGRDGVIMIDQHRNLRTPDPYQGF